MLPDDVLLGIFSSYLGECLTIQKMAEGWQLLVHVCRRWRIVVFGSPRHLDLHIVCTISTPARDTLDSWPALPLTVEYPGDYPTGNADNIVAALERRDRVHKIYLIDVPSSDLEIFIAALQEPFPELTDLRLESDDKTVVVPDSILGGSSPRLRLLVLSRIQFLGLPKLLLSATHLHGLILSNTPHSGYFSPDAMVATLSTLTSLDYFVIGFQSPRSCPNPANRRLPPPARSVLPLLTYFEYKGVSEYLEDIVARIDAPRLDCLRITLFNDIIIDTPQFVQFISRTPMSRAPEKAYIIVRDSAASVHLSLKTSAYMDINVKILCRGLNWQLSSLEQACTSCLPSLSGLEDLRFLKDSHLPPYLKNNIGSNLWLDLLHPFTAVKNLYLSEEFSPHIGPVFQELVEGRTTEVLPALQNIFLEGFESPGSVQEGIGQFVAARQVAGHPIAISRWTNPELDIVRPDWD